MAQFLKRWGLHHLVIGLPLAFVAGPLANMLFWFGKELGEATERAGGSKQAFKKFSAWEPFDFITPSIAGFALDAIISAL